MSSNPNKASSEIAVSVRGLSKRYQIAHNAAQYATAKDAIIETLKHPFRRAERETFHALQDVSFDIQKGDVVGIIGRNGAGKSTLLKILSRITEPTSGTVKLYGRVGSLLEVGTGFHPELTGRENIYLNGAILGMSRREITKQFDAIVDFAGTEKFLDTPVKRYSSGMYVRLAFAVAAHLNPEILILDEVLSVGDAAFQKKCLGKMKDVADQGRTVLFVSHDMTAVIRLCRSAILLEGGRVKCIDKAAPIVDKYLFHKVNQEAEIDLGRLPRQGNLRHEARLVSAEMFNRDSKEPWKLAYGNQLSFTINVQVDFHLNSLEAGLSIFSSGGFEIASSLSSIKNQWTSVTPGSYCTEVTYNDLNLLPGSYNLSIGLRSDFGMEDYLSTALSFEVVTSELGAKHNIGTFHGAIIPNVTYELRSTSMRLNSEEVALFSNV